MINFRCAHLALAMASIGLAGCNTKGDGVTAAPTDLFIQDAAVDELLAFSATIEEVRLIDEQGRETDNLLLEETRVEFRGLESEPLWLARIRPPRGVFLALRVVLDESTVSAMDRAGVVWANTFNRFDPASPFGGYKESGYGREGGRHGLADYLKPGDFSGSTSSSGRKAAR